MPIRTIADVIELEQTPIWTRIPEHSVYERLRSVAERHPDAVALRAITTTSPDEQPREVSFREFLFRITQAANLLTSLGVTATDAVSLLCPLYPESFYALFGAMTAGVANPINPLLEPAHLIGILRDAKAAVLVASASPQAPELWARVEAVRAALPQLKAVLRIGGTGAPPPGVLDFETALQSQPGDALVAPRSIARSDRAAIFHTGGTTGQPRLAPHTHGGLLVAAYTNRVAIGEEPGLVFLGGLPLFHIGGAVICGLARFACGQGVALPTPTGLRNPALIRDYWQVAERLRVNFIGAVPTSLGALLNSPEPGSAPGPDRSRIRVCLTGASALPVEVATRFTRQFGVPVIEGYGMTEVHAYSTINPASGQVRLGSVGLRVPYMELCIAEVSSQGTLTRTCATDEIGHVLMRGPQVFSGYLNPSDNVGTMLADGWLDSGDLGRLDADGYLWLTGRRKDLIIRGGHNLDPQVIEQVLYRHSAVEQAAAVPAPDSYAGELPVAFVQLRRDQQATDAELVAFCRQHIPERAAAPVEVFILPSLPLTAMGKIFKPTLRLEAMRRVFTRELDKLAGQGVRTRLEVSSHPTHGTLARVHIEDSGGMSLAAVQARCQELLGGYTIRHEVVGP